jgi:hypothetical protein
MAGVMTFNKEPSESQAWWHTPVNPALWREKQEDHNFENS